MDERNNSNGLAAYDPAKAWHTVEADQTMDTLEVSSDGLSEGDAQQRLSRYGPNALPEKEAPSVWTVVLRQFESPLIYILLIAGVVSIAIGDKSEAIFIFAVVTLNALIGTFQEYKSEQSAAELEKMMETAAKVRRDGKEREIKSDEVVPGDIVLLESGMRVPADIRLVNRQSLAVDEALLTGESESVNKHTDVLNEKELEPADQANMVFAGTTVMAGRAEGVAVRTGEATELGRIAEAVTGTETSKPPLVIRIDRFVRHLSFIILGAVVAVALITLLQGVVWREVFFLAVALAVSAIPEGLPVGTTVALSVGLRRMADRKVIIRRLTAVEGLGSCTAILSDKTGTLTLNRQTAKLLSLPGDDGFQRYQVSGEGLSGEGEVTPEDGDHGIPEQERERLVQLARASILANEGALGQEDGEWRGEGDPIDIGFLALGHKIGESPEKLRDTFTVSLRLPYESRWQLAGAFYKTPDGGKEQVSVKGSAEAILSHSGSVYHPEQDLPLDKEAILEEANRLAEQGYRVLAVATGAGEPSEDTGDEVTPDHLPEVRFVGLVGFIDPLRPEVKDAVRQCRDAGVRVAMITGDHPDTALTIAKDLGIAQSKDDLLVGSELGEEDGQLDERVLETSVFARIDPIQKLRIVEALGSRGHFVAATGDGVNDAPALRKAHIGVAMGSGTDVTKQTSSIIITDDNFASIVNGIEEGRRAYQNFRKVAYLLISTGAAEVLLFLAALVMGLPLPLVAVQILWLNLITNGIQDVGLAFERGEPGLMMQQPRDPDEPIFNPLMIQQTLVTAGTMAVVAFGAWWYLMGQGMAETEARNLTFLLMVFFENFHAFNCRSETASVFSVPLRNNILLVVAVPVALGIHILALYLPFTQRVLGTEPVSLTTTVILLGCASTVMVSSEVFKFFKRRQLRSQANQG